jgi:hypothetical protein
MGAEMRHKKTLDYDERQANLRVEKQYFLFHPSNLKF